MERYATLLDAVRGVRWLGRAGAAAAPGSHPSRAPGGTADLLEYRLYRQGDELRRLDWKLLARTERAFVRLSSDTVVLPCTLIVDASASMAYPEPGRDKWTLAKELAVGFAAVAHAAADPVGLGIAGEVPAYLPPRARRGVVHQIAAALDAATPAGPDALAASLERARGARRVVIVSDFLGDVDPVVAFTARQAAAGGDVYVVHVVAREELDPPAGDALFVDPEDSRLRRALSESARAEYAGAFRRWREELAGRFRAGGVSYTLAATGAEPAARLVRQIARGTAESETRHGAPGPAPAPEAG